jgi:hypothetical protein
MNWWEWGGDEPDESWISYKTILFLGVIIIGGGYLLNGIASTIKAADDLIDSSDDEN